MSNRLMDITKLRRARVRQLIDERFAGNQAKFAQAAGRPATLVARWFMKGSNARNIGEKVARDMEVKLKLERGWFDLDSAEPAPPPKDDLTVAERQLVRLYREADDEGREFIMASAHASALRGSRGNVISIK